MNEHRFIIRAFPTNPWKPYQGATAYANNEGGALLAYRTYADEYPEWQRYIFDFDRDDFRGDLVGGHAAIFPDADL